MKPKALQIRFAPRVRPFRFVCGLGGAHEMLTWEGEYISEYNCVLDPQGYPFLSSKKLKS